MAAALLALPPVRVLTRVAGAAWDRLRGVQALARLAKGSSAELHFERDALREAGCLLPYDLRVELLPHLPYALRQRAWRPLFSTSYLDGSMRISRDQDGKLFVYVKMSEATSPTDYSEQPSDLGVGELLSGMSVSLF